MSWGDRHEPPHLQSGEIPVLQSKEWVRREMVQLLCKNLSHPLSANEMVADLTSFNLERASGEISRRPWRRRVFLFAYLE